MTRDPISTTNRTRGADQVWPNFLVIGAPKSGTTSLYHYLSQHRDVFLSKVRKEGRFFSGVGDGSVYWPDFYHFDTAPDVSDYQALFADYEGEARIGDVSPDYYAYAPIAARRILTYCGSATKIIAILRNPVDRTWSHYLQNVRRDAEFYSFEKALADEPRRIAANWGFQWLYADTGRYAGRLREYRDRFSDMLVLLQDELDQDGPGTVRRIFDFLEIDADVPVTVEARYNTGGIPRSKMSVLDGAHDHRDGVSFETLHAELVAPVSGVSGATSADGVYPPIDDSKVSIPPMNAATRARLQAQFEPEIVALEDLLGRSLDQWRAS
ncbi:sulfotransferase [Maricaulis sp.]|uniref:sulfotransferase family protein n=1 Tax=Maricaulis sp. TaxID=1486257 RepID=UPI0025B9DB12|nr:sulfotransferase [Maricaulis sp.]